MSLSGFRYATLFGEYVADILRQRHSVEFFIEGTRSRSGKQLAPKKGLLKSLVQNYLNGKVSDVVFVPVVIDYEKVMELAAFAAEMLGYQKRKESLKVSGNSRLQSCLLLRSVFKDLFHSFWDVLFVFLCFLVSRSW